MLCIDGSNFASNIKARDDAHSRALATHVVEHNLSSASADCRVSLNPVRF